MNLIQSICCFFSSRCGSGAADAKKSDQDGYVEPRDARTAPPPPRPATPKPKIRFAVGLESEALQPRVTVLEEESHTYRQAANEARTAARVGGAMSPSAPYDL
jgi:hypothetical protein